MRWVIGILVFIMLTVAGAAGFFAVDFFAGARLVAIGDSSVRVVHISPGPRPRRTFGPLPHHGADTSSNSRRAPARRDLPGAAERTNPIDLSSASLDCPEAQTLFDDL